MIFNNVHLLIIVILFHVVYILSIFDIYFKSPIVHGMEPIHINVTPAAKRVVVISGDGLRGDRTFENQMIHTPYLKTKVFNEGTWGISHTRVPTETRPCHLAMLGGVYEDPSAVTKQWRMSDFNFDTVFNESSYSLGFGAPDIIGILQRSISSEKFESYYFNNKLEDFSKDGTASDIWVRDQVISFFDGAKTDASRNEKLRRDKVVFFYHFNGLDTTGHAFLPQSEKYAENIELVDSLVKEVVEKMEDFYGHDNQTAYIFTGDHGMSPAGNHGDGETVVTSTPFIAWGAGIQKPIKKYKSGHDDFSKDWGLDEYQRVDIEQADITPLVAALNGINFPINSVGLLPVNYLGTSENYKSEAVFTNAKQLLNIYLKKVEIKKEQVFYFKPYPPLSEYEQILTKIETLIKEGNHEAAQEESIKLQHTSLDAIRYMQHYDWSYLMTVVILGYTGSIIYSLTFTIKTYFFQKKKKVQILGNNSIVLVCIVFGLISLYLYINQSPMHYYIYSFFPVFFLILGLKEKEELKYFFNNFIKTKSFYFIGYVIGIELLVYAFFHRSIFTIGYAFLGLGVPFILNKRLIKEHRVFIICWALTCCCTGIFSLLNPNKTENMVILWLGGIMMFCVSVAFIIYFNKHPDSEASKATHYNRIILLLLETINIFISLIIITNTSKNLKEENGLPSLNKNISWTIFLVSFLLPLIYGTFVKQPFMYRCVFIFIGMATPYIILSLSYEMAFYFFIGIVSILWIKLEQLNYLYNQEDIGLPVSHSKYTLIKDRLEIDDIEMDNRGNDDEMGSGENINISLSEENEILDSNEENENVQKSAEHRILVPDDLRISLIFYFLLTSAFFGTGNIASIASFSLQSVYRLITLYEPFTMAFLLILKIFIPFILPSICSSIICRIVDLPVFSIFALTTSLTDLGTINFFLHVRDEGSWLDIGVSISHFVIANCIQIFSVVLYCLTYFLSRKAKV